MEIKTILEKIHKEEVVRYQNGDIPRILILLQKLLISREDLIKLISKRYQMASMFEGFLEDCMDEVKKSDLDESIKESLYQSAFKNYQEEKGNMEEYGGPHKEGRETLLSALGYDYEKWQKPLGTYQEPDEVCDAVKVMLLNLKGLVSKGGVEAITALWYYENRISLDGELGDYYILLRAFENKFPEFKKEKLEDYKEGDVLWHLASHAYHDTYHAKLAFDALNILPYTKENVEKIEKVCEEMRVYIDALWEGLYGEITK